MSFVKNFKFFHSFVFVKVNLEEVFAIKKSIVKNRCFCLFFNGLAPDFYQKFETFSFFAFCQNKPGKSVC